MNVNIEINSSLKYVSFKLILMNRTVRKKVEAVLGDNGRDYNFYKF